MTEEMILKALHELISDAYDWLADSDVDEKGRIQYVLGAHDMTVQLLSKLKEMKEG